jgi:hypothetical protein
MPKVDSPTLAIDFDGVIHDADHPLPGKRMGKPIMGAVESVTALHDRGFKIVIHTVKARSANGTKAVEDWLAFYEIPYHEVTAVKPDADVYLDNKGMRFDGNWQLALMGIWTLTGLSDTGEGPPLLRDDWTPTHPNMVFPTTLEEANDPTSPGYSAVVKPNTSRAPENSRNWEGANIVEIFKSDLFEDEEEE